MTTNTENSLAKNVAEIIQKSYVIPFYQRNYNWGNAEISQFIQDIYESYINNPKQNYYIGSLEVYAGSNKQGRQEVIDGQQRLTTIHILARLFPNKNYKPARLKYDSRPEVETFFDRLKIEKAATKQTEEDEKQSNLNNFFTALETISNIKLEGEVNSVLTFKTLETQNKLEGFINYFYNKVMLVEVLMPPDTDVANYFEIMNNRGRQLQEHEILKAQLMSKINSPKERSIFGYVWDACSQMDRPIQKFFNTEQRAQLFGDNYDGIHLGNLKKLAQTNTKESVHSILDILESKTIQTTIKSLEEHEDELDQEITYTAIIDFNNFLIHILKLIFPKADVPLSSDKLLKIYKSIPSRMLMEIEPMDFLSKLFFYRVVFDRYLVKSAAGSENADEPEAGDIQELEGLSHTRWMLTKPVMYWKNYAYRGRRYPSLNFKNTFDNQDLQERIVKLLSMLQVTYRQRKNKNYLQFVLSLFDPEKPKTLDLDAESFLSELEDFTLNQFDKLGLETYLKTSDEFDFDEMEIYAEGTNTPHFLFNLIDYLMWVDRVWNDKDWGIDEAFDFSYRNSIEHHFPQAQIHMMEGDKNAREPLIHSLGNLCLISKGANSKLNDRSAWDKATDPRYSGGILTPKRKIMYATTQKSKMWNATQIKEHYNEIIKLLSNRYKILDPDHE
ncbi:DUF262 domain-containing protein [Shivajiella indica]|uniref:DUF262 domain-containing protein n=1 Tax=Shivajiella indica TaxID=872115 RepID=A0ABW5BCX8_9BACT